MESRSVSLPLSGNSANITNPEVACLRSKTPQNAAQRQASHHLAVRGSSAITEATIYTQNTRTPTSDTLQAHYRQLDVLRQERAKHTQTMQELQADVTRGKLAYGRLTQEWLRIGRARELKKKHVLEDEESLLREQYRMHHAEEEISAVLADISKLVLDTR